jgi:ADP-ribose pyrophosphatase YjhB (NUDIX family)
MKRYPESGGPIHRHVPDGDNRARLVCQTCGFVNYDNPKIVVGAVVADGERLLLCRRAIEPQRGFWTIPAGYLELNESIEDGARREAAEEAGARIVLDGLLAVYNVPRISQVQLIFRARLDDQAIAAGAESLGVGLFDWADIPWDQLAFPSVLWALRHYRAGEQNGQRAPFRNPDGASGDYLPGQPAA